MAAYEPFTPFPNTTERSANVGKDGFDSDWHWAHFDGKYRRPCLTYLGSVRARRPDLAEDAFQVVCSYIHGKRGLAYDNRNFRFRTVLGRCLKSSLFDLIRKEKPSQFRTYLARTAALRSPTRQSDESYRRTRIESAVRSLAAALASDGYKDLPFYERFDAFELMVWRHRIQPGATGASTAHEIGLSESKTSRACRHVSDEILRLAHTALAQEDHG